MQLTDRFVYIVESSAGRYDDYHWWISGIFESEEEANKYAQQLNNHNELLKESECPINIPMEDMTEEEEEKYCNWLNDKNYALEQHKAVVKKYPFNKSQANVI